MPEEKLSLIAVLDEQFKVQTSFVPHKRIVFCTKQGQNYAGNSVS
jgi:hypothetical protein